MALCVSGGGAPKLLVTCGKLLADAGGEEWASCLQLFKFTSGVGTDITKWKCYRLPCNFMDVTISGYTTDTGCCENAADVNGSYELPSNTGGCSWLETGVKTLGCVIGGVDVSPAANISTINVTFTTCTKAGAPNTTYVFFKATVTVVDGLNSFPHYYYGLVDTVDTSTIDGQTCEEVAGTFNLTPSDNVLGINYNPYCDTLECTNSATRSCFGWCPAGYEASSVSITIAA